MQNKSEASELIEANMLLPPYPGQGKPLPDDVPFTGEWVIENKVFIYWADPPKSHDEFGGLKGPDGLECDGFDAHYLAESLEISVVELVDSNRRGKLFVEWRDMPLKAGLVRTREYDFKTPTRGVRMKFSAALSAGKA